MVAFNLVVRNRTRGTELRRSMLGRTSMRGRGNTVSFPIRFVLVSLVSLPIEGRVARSRSRSSWTLSRGCFQSNRALWRR